MIRSKLRMPRGAIALTVLLAAGAAQASAQTADVAGDFVSQYLGPKNGDLDVISSQVFFDGSRFALTATMNGPIGTTPNAFYVFGFNRGAAASPGPFANLGFPNVLFDVAVTVTPGIGVKVGTAFVGTFFSIIGNTINAVIPLSAIPQTGVTPPSQYLWNLWPRNPGAPTGAGTTPVTDFAPEGFDVQVTNVDAIPPSIFATPEPVSMAMMGTGLLLMGFVAARRRRVS